VDEKVKAIAITGSNENFLSGLRKQEGMTTLEYLELTSSLATFLGTMNKPLFALVTGKCSDMGIELALLCDTILAMEKTEFIISPNYLPSMGLTKTLQRFSHFRKGTPVEGINCDRILPEETFLDESSKYIQDHMDAYLVLIRQERLSDFNRIINFEQKTFALKSMSSNEVENSKVKN
jgi:Enoyl-CoA hydratase/carnithine racemase